MVSGRSEVDHTDTKSNRRGRTDGDEHRYRRHNQQARHGRELDNKSRFCHGAADAQNAQIEHRKS
jgi:hypothetical protein